jgi:predicted RNase H-like HicB family nuclease
MNFKGTVIIRQEEEWFVATCLENNVASQGKTMDEAMANVKEAVALYYEDEKDDKTEEISFPQNKQVFITTLELAI